MATCGKAPLLGAVGVYGIELIIIRAKVDSAINSYGGRGLDRPTCGEAPLHDTGRVYGIEPIIIRANVDSAISFNGRGGLNRPT